MKDYATTLINLVEKILVRSMFDKCGIADILIFADEEGIEWARFVVLCHKSESTSVSSN